MIPIVIPAYAKINLAIDIVGKVKKNNYHKLNMINIPVLLHDTIELSLIKNPNYHSTYLYCDDPNIECDESNTVYKAFSYFQDYYDTDANFKIFIYKRIPVEAGLGGGSSDAAAVLKALYKFNSKDNGKKMKKNELCYDKAILDIAQKVGSDVTFSLLNKPSHVTGIGDKLEPIKIKTAYNVLIVKPKNGLSTTKIYKLYDQLETKDIPRPNINELIKALEIDDEKNIQKNLVNVLTVPALDELPIISDILERFKELNLPLSGMSGTGSACFALSKEIKSLKKAKKIFYDMGCDVFLTRFII